MPKGRSHHFTVNKMYVISAQKSRLNKMANQLRYTPHQFFLKTKCFVEFDTEAVKSDAMPHETMTLNTTTLIVYDILIGKKWVIYRCSYQYEHTCCSQNSSTLREKYLAISHKMRVLIKQKYNNSVATKVFTNL
jgi:hypothetical protein